MRKSLILLIFLLLLSSCALFETPLEEHENEITLTLDEKYANHLELNGNELPTFTFKFNGKLKILKNTMKHYHVTFKGNDDIILSDALKDLFNRYKDNLVITEEKKITTDVSYFSYLKDGKVKNRKYEPDDGFEYLETAYIGLENGLQLEVNYRRFKYDGLDYYTWRFDRGMITIFLYYPLMVVKDNGDDLNKLLLLALPKKTSFKVGPDLRLDKLLNGNKYIKNDDYYTFSYNEKDNKKEDIKNFYLNLNGKEEAGKISYTYLGNEFSVEFKDDDKFIIRQK